jgi:hypothetical protein
MLAMKSRAIAYPVRLWGVAALCACSSSGDGGSDPVTVCAPDNGEPVVVDSVAISEAAEFLGLQVGARWTYENTDFNEGKGKKVTTVTKEITGCETVTVVDCEESVAYQYNAYVQETTGGAAGAEDSNTLYMVALPEGVVRVRQDIVDNGVFEQVVSYSPYFMRLFEGPYDVDREETFSHHRWELSADGEVARGHTVRSYTHLVVAADEPVDVLQGSYDNVLHMKRSEVGSDEDVKDFWYVRGVGKVLEMAYDMAAAETKKEELATFSEGTGSCN